MSPLPIPLPIRHLFAALVLLSGFLGGCESVRDRLRPTRDVQAQTREFDATAEAVLAAVPAALARLGFTITGTSSAHGSVEAISDVRREAGLRSTRQLRLKLIVVDLDGGFSKGSLQGWEMQVEENARGEPLATEVGVESGSFHQSVFDAIKTVLEATAKADS